jgi:two-component system cell cycle sensor histidine kinase/response regulator CckA
LLLFYDVTAIQKRESQMLESQKLQALGQLAGGISHAFNNLLTAMLGFCDLLLQKHTPQDTSFTDIMQIKQNANRAANLVRQLLLFAKHAPPDPRPLDLREALNEMSFLLRRLIGTKIDLQIRHERGARMIYADLGQFEQIIMNLAVNARDAMVDGGELIFRTHSILLKEPLKLLRHTLDARAYIIIEVQDTGCGISKENLERIFVPFFSTKLPGRGTGLGLANVYQILESMEGGIEVQSTPGVGTTFRLYIPRYTEKKRRLEEEEGAKPEGQLLDFWEEARILIVEDEDPVRLFAARALKSKGYEVWEAKDGAHGFEILQKNPSIGLLITDVMMPGIDGPTLVNAAYSLNPHLKVIFVSGYPEEEIQTKLHFPKGQVYFLPKPFNLNELALKVHQVLGEH